MTAALNDAQLAAVGSKAKTTLLHAGPGAGKTRTLIARILWQLARGVGARDMIAFTFTNSGANVIARRLAPTKLAYIGTIHGFGLRLINNHGYLIGYRVGGVSIVTEEAKLALLKQAREKLGRKISDKEMMEGQSEAARLIWGEYRHTVKRANMVDYDRILVDAAQILSMGVPGMRTMAELLADELQDSGPADWDIIWGIPTESRFLVGDVDQSIFTFRGADPMLFMHADRGNRSEHVLELNYRSDVNICSAANELIAHNSNRIPKQIIPHSVKPGLVRVAAYQNEGEEIYGVWGMICALGIEALNETAVLARTRKIAAKYRETLRGLGLPIKQTSVQLPRDWSLVLTMLSLIVDPQNNFHAEALMRHHDSEEDFIIAERERAYKLGTTLTDLLFPALAEVKTIEEALVRLDVSQESHNILVGRWKELPEGATVGDLLADLWNSDKWTMKDDRPGITICTMHAAKGLEWDNVFVVAMEDEIIPHGRGVGIEDERRLCFVAVTRARHRLYLSWSRERIAFFQTQQHTRSRFIAEMGIQ